MTPVRPSILLNVGVYFILAGLSCHSQPVTLPLLPPQIVDCSPKPFAANVDPNTGWLTITFDRPMAGNSAPDIGPVFYLGSFPGVQESVSWDSRGRVLQLFDAGPVVYGGTYFAFRELPGFGPSWDDTRTVFKLPVRLAPDATYAVAVNASGPAEFRDEAGMAALSFAWVFATGERKPEDFPPAVVATDPPPGAGAVDPERREIRVTCNRPLVPGDAWWTIRALDEPPVAEPMQQSAVLSADGRTATLNVSLRPRTAYAVQINSVLGAGFRDRNGRPVVPYATCFRTPVATTRGCLGTDGSRQKPRMPLPGA